MIGYILGLYSCLDGFGVMENNLDSIPRSRTVTIDGKTITLREYQDAQIKRIKCAWLFIGFCGGLVFGALAAKIVGL